jgi:hypothetical protein
LTTRATIERYRHTTDLVRQGAEPPPADATAALQWLLAAELAATTKNKG